MSATAILDRLSRVKQTRPGAWMSACPCCESRKGRPLAVTETSDGRVLIHAFCGCSTADVLDRLGLALADLFDKPIGIIPPTHARVPAADVLAAVSHEVSVVAFIAADFLECGEISAETWKRLATAVARIGNANVYASERAK